MLVADALDAVLAEAQLSRGSGTAAPRWRPPAATGTGCADSRRRRSSRRIPWRSSRRPAGSSRCGSDSRDLLDDRPGHLVVPDGVAELLELVEDHHRVAALGPQLPALVVDLLDVGLAAGGGDDLVGADLAQPLEALAAHALGQDRHRRAGEQRAVVGAATAVVAGRRPDRLLARRVEVARHQPRHQAAVGRAHLVRAGGKPLAQTRPTILASTPVSSEGNSIQLPSTNPPPRSTASLCQVMRKRLAGSMSHRPSPASEPTIAAGILLGSFCCANVGRMTLRSRARSTDRCRTSSLMDSMIFIALPQGFAPICRTRRCR